MSEWIELERWDTAINFYNVTHMCMDRETNTLEIYFDGDSIDFTFDQEKDMEDTCDDIKRLLSCRGV